MDPTHDEPGDGEAVEPSGVEPVPATVALADTARPEPASGGSPIAKRAAPAAAALAVLWLLGVFLRRRRRG